MTGDWRWQVGHRGLGGRPVDPTLFQGATERTQTLAEFPLVGPQSYGTPPVGAWPAAPAWALQAPPAGYYGADQGYPANVPPEYGTLSALSAAAYAGAPILDPQAYASLYAQAMGGASDPYGLAAGSYAPPPVASPWLEEPAPLVSEAMEPETVVEDNPVLRALGLQGL